MNVGDIVYWITGECDAEIIRDKGYGEYVIMPTVGKLPITTRRCFLIVKAA